MKIKTFYSAVAEITRNGIVVKTEKISATQRPKGLYFVNSDEYTKIIPLMFTKKDLGGRASMLTPTLFRAIRETESDAVAAAKDAAEKMMQTMSVIRNRIVRLADEQKGVVPDGKAQKK